MLREAYRAHLEWRIVINLGAGVRCSAFDGVKAFEAACGLLAPSRIGRRRPGDVSRVMSTRGCPLT